MVHNNIIIRDDKILYFRYDPELPRVFVYLAGREQELTLDCHDDDEQGQVCLRLERAMGLIKEERSGPD